MGRITRSEAGPAVLNVPEGTQQDVLVACRCIRTFYVVNWEKLLMLRGITFRGVPVAYDRPDNKSCIWFEMYQFSQNQSSPFNPLWGLDRVLKESLTTQRDVNLRSVMNPANTTPAIQHGLNAAKDRVISVTAGVTAYRNSKIDGQCRFGLSERSAAAAAIRNVVIDPLLKLFLVDKLELARDIADVTDARLAYAYSPQSYVVSDAFCKRWNLRNYFSWASVDVVGCNLEDSLNGC